MNETEAVVFDFGTILGICLFAALIVVGIIGYQAYNRSQKDKALVKQLSRKKLAIEELNTQFNIISPSLEKTIWKKYKSLQEYSRYELNEIFQKEVTNDADFYLRHIRKVKDAQKQYVEYNAKFNDILNTDKEEDTVLYNDYPFFKDVERSICLRLKQFFVPCTEITVKKEYTSPAGRNHYSLSHKFGFDELNIVLRPIASKKRTLSYEDYVAQNDNLDEGDDSSSIEFTNYSNGGVFVNYIADLLRENGFESVAIPKDNNNVVLSTRGEVWFFIQCIYSEDPVETVSVQRVLRNMLIYKRDVAIVLTNNTFTSEAIHFGKLHNLILWDEKQIDDLANHKIPLPQDQTRLDYHFMGLLKGAVQIAISNQKVSASLLQKELGVGPSTANRLLDEMERRKYITPLVGTKPRSVLISQEEFDLFDFDVDMDD